MLFSQFNFWIFFAVVVGLVAANAWSLRSIQLQKIIFLLSSYYFYGQWDYRFLSLIILSTVVDYIAGAKIPVSAKPGRWLAFSVVVNLGILGFFKYFDFFQYEFVTLLASAGLQADAVTLGIILPVGISFYTFQTLTYSIDIYRGKLKPTHDVLAFACFVAFFPQLVAGPIERARNIIPQFERLWSFDEQKTLAGCKLILVGLFLKVVIADGIAPYVNQIFADPSVYGTGDLMLGAAYFAVQIYADFCGYSTIAIGIAKILGIELMTNFRTPFFAPSQTDFWRRWHISLSSFFRDYVTIPLARTGWFKDRFSLNILFTFTLCGLWHGANWTFIVWGAYMGGLLALEKVLKQNVAPANVHGLEQVFRASLTFSLFAFGATLFRAESIGHTWLYVSSMFSGFSIPLREQAGLLYVFLCFSVDWFWKNDTRLEQDYIGLRSNVLLRWFAYTAMFWMTFYFSYAATSYDYIYFQF
jgi:alginate O-acetyltransferase complex protein AlgI